MKHYRLFLMVVIVMQINGCVTKGLITDRFDKSFYQVNLLEPTTFNQNPTFIVYGDSQPAWSVYQKFIQRDNWWTPKMFLFPFAELYWLSNGAIGTFNILRKMPDYGRETRLMMRDIAYEIAKDDRADFILNTGDNMGQDGRRPDNWEIFLRENMHEHPLLREVPYIPTPGNHERVFDQAYGQANYDAVFNYPFFNVLEFPDVALFVVNSSMIIDFRNDLTDNQQDSLFKQWFISDDPDHPAWLEQELQRSTKPFKIISMHHTPFSYGHHWKDWYKPSFGPDIRDKRNKLIQLYQQNGVQLVFSGHDHIYQHTVLSDTAANDIHFVVSSSGGVPPRSQLSQKKRDDIQQLYLNDGYNVDPIMNERVYHYCLVTVDSDTMRVETYKVDETRMNRDKLIEEIVVSHSPASQTLGLSKQR